MEMFCKYTLISFLLFRQYIGDVNLKIILKPPIATLECLITYPKETSSTILMCPNDNMCFQNCDRICSSESCVTNNITCTSNLNDSFKKYIYNFNILNPQNRGEWICYYGSEKGSTVILYEEPVSTNTKRDTTSLEKNASEQVTQLSSISTTTYSVISTTTGRITMVNSYYVVLLLVIFSISLLINIVFLTRDMLTSISTKKAFGKHNKENYPGWLAICIKIFCLEKVIKIRQARKTNHQLAEHNPLISRQVSSNIYEHPAAFHFQTPFILENYAYAGTPANERFIFANNFSRSKSFPVKNSEPNLYSPTPKELKSLRNQIDPGTKENNNNDISNNDLSTNELTNQIIYDDVAESTIQCYPYDNAYYFSSLARPNQRISRHFSMQKPNPMVAASLNNLNLHSKYPSDSMIGNSTDPPNENLLKDAINSRVELSKEMINQADNLLRQADNLLNKKESPKNS